MDTPKIYVACLASYNSGILYGQWIDTDQGINEIQDQVNTMLTKSPIEQAEEWAIHDYEGFGGIRLSEYEGLETVANYTEFIIEHSELGQALIADYGLEEAQTMMDDHYHGSYDSEIDFARYVLEEHYSNPIPDDWQCYFDYEAFARDLFINDFCSVEVDGTVHVFSYH
ncbi:MAG: antirestriction protein ArdA [bacterium]|nr:antirestriction protein ArdA [bacterium]